MNIYQRTLESLDKVWLHNKFAEIMSCEKPSIEDADMSVICRWLRGFHQSVHSNNGDYWQAYTQPYHQFGPWTATFIRRYLTDMWAFLVDYLPTLPSSPSSPVLPIGTDEDRETPRQRALL